MPIYEYVCGECGERFERLLMSVSAQDEVVCPFCGSDQVERAVSCFSSFGSCAPTRSFG